MSIFVMDKPTGGTSCRPPPTELRTKFFRIHRENTDCQPRRRSRVGLRIGHGPRHHVGGHGESSFPSQIHGRPGRAGPRRPHVHLSGHDVCPPPHNHYHIDEWLCFSSADLRTWTEHSVPLRAADFAWARGEAWAGQVVERDGRFYWYVTVEHATDRGKSVGVAVADRPEGPYRDARGSALISNSMTSPESGMMWDDIDPTVIVDDDGQAYLIWGNRRCYMARLAPGMTEIEGEIRTIDLPSYTEAP